MNEKTKQASADAARALMQSMKEGDGLLPREADDNLNDAQRRLIDAMVEEHGTVYLGKVNLYKERGKMPEFRKYPDGKIVCNFACSFVVPVDDQQLKQMIYDRDTARYTGVVDDVPRVEAIHNRIYELDGQILTWS